jgi:hypothetical protein
MASLVPTIHAFFVAAAAKVWIVSHGGGTLGIEEESSFAAFPIAATQAEPAATPASRARQSAGHD